MKSGKIVSLLIVFMVFFAGTGLYYAWELISTGAAYKAKILCSGVFVSKRSPESVINSDLAIDDLAILRYIQASVDQSTRSVSSTFLRIIRQTATYHPDLGCTLVFAGHKNGKASLSDNRIPEIDPERGKLPEIDTETEVAEHVDRDLLGKAVSWAFSEPDPEHLRRTRAVVIVHKGHIVGERYAPGIDMNTPLIGWSMTKSVMNALVGVLVEQGNLSITDEVEAPEWQGSNDGRCTITINHLLQMSSGLDFDEDYSDPLADAMYMLLRVPNMAGYAADKKLVAEPGSRWRYSSGTTNILSRALRKTTGELDYLFFPRRALFGPLGMDNAVIELDASGTFVGSSFMYATAREWAKFGQLYLQDGIWQGQRMLPNGWVSYTTTPAPQAPENKYGAHFWLKIPTEYTSGTSANRLPEDAFHAAGAEGQFVTIIPSYDLVIVRLGLSRYASAWQHDEFVSKVIEAVKSNGADSEIGR